MQPVERVAAANDFAQVVLDIATRTVASAIVTLTDAGPRDPRIVSLALLSRTISNFKGAIIMVSEGLIIEAQTLTRCCYENLIWISALKEQEAEFVQSMLKDESASRKKIAQLAMKFSGRSNNESIIEDSALLRKLIRDWEERFPDRKKLHVDKTAVGGSVELAYAIFSQLSLSAAHPTISALGRHLKTETDDHGTHLVIDVVPATSSAEALRLIWLSCDALLGVSIKANELCANDEMQTLLRSATDQLRQLAEPDLAVP